MTASGRRRGRLIAFEGGEASGKSTQAALLARHLGAELTCEPGGTPLGKHLRDLVLDASASVRVDARAEALLLLADRAQHMAERVRPALDAATDVVTDRSVGSTLAYQGHGRGLDVEELRRLSAWASGGVEPDLVVLLDVPWHVTAARLGAGERDRMEAENDGFHRRVVEGYRRLARADPARWVVVDGTAPVDEVAERVRDAVDRFFSASPGA